MKNAYENDPYQLLLDDEELPPENDGDLNKGAISDTTTLSLTRERALLATQEPQKTINPMTLMWMAANTGRDLGNQFTMRLFGIIDTQLNDIVQKLERKRELSYSAIEGMTLGLTREQVLTPNFGYHTIDAIRKIQKRTKELSLVEAFEMVKDKSYNDTNDFVTSYLERTKKPQKPIDQMTLIRVVVNTGRGFGNQRAAITLMQKLREMRFYGIFDIQCDDRLGYKLLNTNTGMMYTNHEPLVSRQLKSMIPGFESAEPDADGVRVVYGLGSVKISSLPGGSFQRDRFELPEADLAVCAADDIVLYEERQAKMFNAACYIGLEPTDWDRGRCFVTDQDGIVVTLPHASQMRLSSIAAYQKPNLSEISLSVTEQRIINTISNTHINSQLVYGLYPDSHFDFESCHMVETGNLDEATEMQRILEANLLLSQKIGKPSILLLPQTIALARVKGNNRNIHFVDLTKDDLDITTYQAGNVIVAYTGRLQQAFFDHLMLEGTTLPPVIEGCNSRETCESAGRPFIHGSAKYDHLKQYAVEASDKQQLHTHASLCLEQGDPRYLPQLVQYMEESLTSNDQLIEYHLQRREAFLSRPDACEVAFNALGIPYVYTFDSLKLTALHACYRCDAVIRTLTRTIFENLFYPHGKDMRHSEETRLIEALKRDLENESITTIEELTNRIKEVRDRENGSTSYVEFSKINLPEVTPEQIQMQRRTSMHDL